MGRCVQIGFSLGLLALLSGCIHPPVPHHGGGHRERAPVVVHRPGPPPHAPAHGHRHRHAHDGVDLVFDSGLGVYTVIGFADHYFHDGYFYRQMAFGWEMSVRLNGGWAVARYSAVPPRLTARPYKRHHKYKQKHKRWKHRRHHRKYHH